MTSKIFVGNLPFSADDERLKNEFERFGQVVSTKIVMDRNSGRSRGYGFVEFNEDTSAQNAVDSMNEQEMDGRKLTVSLAKKQA